MTIPEIEAKKPAPDLKTAKNYDSITSFMFQSENHNQKAQKALQEYEMTLSEEKYSETSKTISSVKE